MFWGVVVKSTSCGYISLGRQEGWRFQRQKINGGSRKGIERDLNYNMRIQVSSDSSSKKKYKDRTLGLKSFVTPIPFP